MIKATFLLFCFLVLCGSSSAQRHYGFTIGNGLRPGQGNSLGAYILGKPDTVSRFKGSSLGFQYGGNFMWTRLGQRTFMDVPLIAPQKGLAKVELANRAYSLSALLRCNYYNKSAFTPYMGLFIGYGFVQSLLLVDPYLTSYGNIEQKKTVQKLYSAHSLVSGLELGVNTRFSEYVSFNFGMSCSGNFTDAELINTQTAYANASGVYLETTPMYKTALLLQVGLVIHFSSSVKTVITPYENKEVTGEFVNNEYMQPSRSRQTSNMVQDYYYNGVYVGGANNGWSNGGTHVGAGRTGSTNPGNGGGGINSQSYGGTGNSGTGVKANVNVHINGK